MECSKPKFMFHFFKAIFDTSFRPLWPSFSKQCSFLQINCEVNTILRQHWPVLNVTYFLPKPWTEQFAHVNGKQQVIVISVWSEFLVLACSDGIFYFSGWFVSSCWLLILLYYEQCIPEVKLHGEIIIFRAWIKNLNSSWFLKQVA